MSWNPTSAELTRPAIRGASMELDCMNLWQEFLEGWFSGATVELLLVERPMPSAYLTFQQGALIQPLDRNSSEANPRSNLGIGLVWVKGTQPRRRRCTPDGTTSFQPAKLCFYLRSKGANTGEGGPEVLVRNAADLLYGVLNNKGKTMPLARKGCGHIRAENPRAIASADFAMRSMEVTAMLQFLNDEVATSSTRIIADNEGVPIGLGAAKWKA